MERTIMFKHIVMWNLMEEANGAQKVHNAKEMKKRLMNLPNIIEEIQEYEVGINQGKSAAGMDVVLISGFKDADDFDTYRKHPEHQKVVEFIRSVQSEARVVDYSTN